MNILDYLAWRGDLTFAQSEFNEVDNLILCYLVYVNMDGIAPGMGEGAMTVSELSRHFFRRYTEKDLKKDKSFIRFAPIILKKMARTERFGNLLVRNYVNKVDMEKMLQFAAIKIELGDDTTFIAYRGTDDTIVGWKEDFYLSDGEVPAGGEAFAYLNAVGRMDEQTIYIGGHSKGGNLGIYAATFCEPEIQERISVIYNNDGPGFPKVFFENPGWERVRGKIKRLIPESSIIGMLLEHRVEPIVIQSCTKGVMQHDGLSWEVLGASFVHCEEISNFAVGMNESISGWLAQIKDEQREQIIDDLFSVLEATQATTLTELQDGGIKNIRTIKKEIDEMNSDSKEALQELLREMMQNIPQMMGIAERFGLKKK